MLWRCWISDMKSIQPVQVHFGGASLNFQKLASYMQPNPVVVSAVVAVAVSSVMVVVIVLWNMY